ncbi:hypothetical protein TW84_04655 [Vibrio neptunius]|uniref:DUF2804 domain-containing protein n=1 Tax=Vibrio neptunius TaxID=170651 RepID=UPI0005FA185F|nr:DUF2804 domain-containing protein [Vibrio neptunius]KJY93242.1 hypothetical protein TW84_04655 [Vibrio neptunius]
MMMSQAAPEYLIQSNGKPCFGHFDGVPKQLGIQHFAYCNNMDRKVGRLKKYFHYKQFQFVSIMTPRYVIGLAIADIRYVGSAFCYVYDVQTDTLVEQSWLRPLNIDKQMSPSPYQGSSHIAAKKLAFEIAYPNWQVKASTDLLQLDVSLQPPSSSLPLSLCTPTGYNGWTYTKKHNALAVKGNITVGGNQIDTSLALGGYDFSAGYMRRETSWRWASINGFSDKSKLGLNLAAGVNETGSHENALWVDEVRHLLGAVHFHFDRQANQKKWRIFSDDGRVDLTFTPLNNRSEKLNLWVLQSNFRQFIGHFSGVIKDDNGVHHTVEQQLGLTEDHFARW